MKLNENIANLRKKKDITQEELATAIGVTNQSVSKWESGQCCPDIALLPALADFFEVSIDELMGHKSAQSNETLQIDSQVINRAIDDKTVVFGEVGLSGEVRSVSMAAQRVQEAKKLGFKKCILPHVCMETLSAIQGIELIGVKNIQEAVSVIQ